MPNPIVKEEQSILTHVAEYLANVSVQPDTKQSTSALIKHYESEMLSLRDQIAEARLEDVPALTAHMLQLSALIAGAQPKVGGLLDANSPYFGHLRLQEGGKVRDVMVGKQALVNRTANVVIVDWRNAPVSRLYYCYDEGDDYEEEFSGRRFSGMIEARRSVTINGGILQRIRCPQGNFVRLPSDSGEAVWTEITPDHVPELKGGAGVAVRPTAQYKPKLGKSIAHYRADKHLPEITSLIDTSQFDAMTQDQSGLVVLQGGAGSGKTTILLHRIAYLTFQNAAHFRPKHIMVIVFSEALAEYVKNVLPDLGLHGVQVMDYRGWIHNYLPQVVSIKDRRKVDEAPSDVSTLKKHPFILQAIQKQVESRRQQWFDDLEGAIKNADEKTRIVQRAQDLAQERPLVPALRALLNWMTSHASQISNDSSERARRVTMKILERTDDVLGEWEELITDRELLKGTGLSEAELTSALNWTSKQIEEPGQYASIDADRRKSIDDRELDDGEPIFALDPHDGPILLNMVAARHGKIVTSQGKALAYDHIAIDEAQDLSAVEIHPLYVTLSEQRSMTLAGDILQKVVFDNGFEDWSTLLSDLGTQGKQVEPFQISYRSTAEITAFAHALLGPYAPKELPKAVRRGGEVEIFTIDEKGEEIAFLAEHLRDLMHRERDANVAILTRYPERADFYYEMLKRADVPFLRRAQKTTFSFTPGIDVTHMAEVKGLEYDYVILLEVTRAMYPDTIESRHLLHIGATRAAYQLWVTTAQNNRSAILPAPSVLQ